MRQGANLATCSVITKKGATLTLQWGLTGKAGFILVTQRFKGLLRAIVVALGVTTIYLFWLVGPLVTSTQDAIYHWDGSPSQLFVAPILDFCAFWLLLALVMIFARGKLRIAIWCVIIALIPWVDIKNWGYLSRTNIPHWLSVLTLGLALSVFPFLLVLWRS